MFASHILPLATERMSLIKAQGMESMAILLPILFQFCNVLAFSNGISMDDETCALALHKSRATFAGYHYLAKGLPAHELEACDSEVGLGRLEKYQQEGEEFCASEDVSSVSFSCVASWSEKSKEVAKSDDYLCRGTGMKLQLSSLSEPPFVKLYGTGTGCNWDLSEHGLQLQYFLFGNQTVPLSLQSGPITGSCDEDTASLVLYSEYDLWNPFINQAQAIMAFASIAALDLDPKSLRLLLLDLDPRSETLLLQNKPSVLVALLEGLFSQGGLAVRRGAQPQLVCADRLILPNGGHQSFIRKTIEKDPWAAKCHNAPIVHGFAAFLKESFTVTSKLVPENWRIILLPRHASETHPDPFNREMENSEDVAQGLMVSETSRTSLLSERSQTESLISALTEAGAVVQELQLETLSVSEQLDAIANTDLLISPHSAALSWMLVLPLCAQVLEIYANRLFQFVNYANLAGVEHHFVTIAGVGWGTQKFTLDVKLIVQEALAARGRREKCLKNNL